MSSVIVRASAVLKRTVGDIDSRSTTSAEVISRVKVILYHHFVCLVIDLIGQLNIAEHHLQTNHRIDRAFAEYVIYSKLFNRTNATELMPTVITCA